MGRDGKYWTETGKNEQIREIWDRDRIYWIEREHIRQKRKNIGQRRGKIGQIREILVEERK